MAYDPEARETGNSAMIIGVVALVLVVGGALAYFATRQPESVDNSTVISRTVVNATPGPSTVVVNQPASPPAVVVAPGTHTNTTTSVNRTTTIHDKVVATPAAGTAGSSGTSTSNTNVTVNVPATGGTGGDTSAARATGNSATANSAGANSATSNAAGGTGTNGY